MVRIQVSTQGEAILMRECLFSFSCLPAFQKPSSQPFSSKIIW